MLFLEYIKQFCFVNKLMPAIFDDDFSIDHEIANHSSSMRDEISDERGRVIFVERDESAIAQFPKNNVSFHARDNFPAIREIENARAVCGHHFEKCTIFDWAGVKVGNTSLVGFSEKI